MPRFLIEVTHDKEPVACARVVKVFLTSGSHLLSNADWGCSDDDHRCWMIVDVESRADALRIVPPAFRGDARVVALGKFTLEEIDAIIARHERA